MALPELIPELDALFWNKKVIKNPVGVQARYTSEPTSGALDCHPQGRLTGCPLAPTGTPPCWASVPFTAIPSRTNKERPRWAPPPEATLRGRHDRCGFGIWGWGLMLNKVRRWVPLHLLQCWQVANILGKKWGEILKKRKAKKKKS